MADQLRPKETQYESVVHRDLDVLFLNETTPRAYTLLPEDTLEIDPTTHDIHIVYQNGEEGWVNGRNVCSYSLRADVRKRVKKESAEPPADPSEE